MQPTRSVPSITLFSPFCSGKALLDDFADEVADIVGGGEGASAIDAVFQRHRASQKFGADLEAQVGAGAVGECQG